MFWPPCVKPRHADANKPNSSNKLLLNSKSRLGHVFATTRTGNEQIMPHDEHESQDSDQHFEQVAKRLAGRTAVTSSGELDLLASVGGLRGIAEAVVPALVFLVAFIISTDLWISGLFAVGLAAVAGLVRLIQRQPLTQALAGVFGVAVSA